MKPGLFVNLSLFEILKVFVFSKRTVSQRFKNWIEEARETRFLTICIQFGFIWAELSSRWRVFL
jgi:hypothetical protein